MVGQKVRVLAAESNKRKELESIKIELQKEGIEGWINKGTCGEISEENHQQNRRTDFKLIRL
ncbi:hypothetical protein N9I20_03220 [Flavobacteriaceae bacterium]|nr:hypothetical protein [Flavobacteriaceae bacterium]